MPEAERTELIEPVTRWVLNEALRQQRIWHDARPRSDDGRQHLRPQPRPHSDLPETVAELTETWGIAADRLTLELTEGALIEAAAPEVLTPAARHGQRLSIDDFGTGYSSLAYLQRLPVDEIKIDRSFVMRLSAASDDAVIVRSTIDLAHNLGLTVVAEGVEDEQSLDMLVDYGCDSAQGYFFAARARPTSLSPGWPSPRSAPRPGRWAWAARRRSARPPGASRKAGDSGATGPT